MSNFGSYVKALRKAYTHLTEEPKVFPPHKSNRSGCNLLIIKGKHNIE